MGIEIGQGDAADTRAKADRARITALTAHPALYPAARNAGIADNRKDLPRPLTVAALQCVRLARDLTLTAEAAFAETEIDDRKTAVANPHNAGRTCWQAVTAARTTRLERLFGDRPGRAQRRA